MPARPHRSVYRLGLIGCGQIARALHAPVAREHPRLQLAALCDTSAENLRRLAEAHAPEVIHRFQDPAALLAAPLDIVGVCTPPASHAALVAAALRHGKHVVCEKPLLVDPADGPALLREACAARKQVVVNHSQDHWPVHRWLRAALQRGLFGRLLSVRLAFSVSSRYAAPHQAPWNRGDRGLDALHDLGTHLIGLALSLFGEVTPVRCLRRAPDACDFVLAGAGEVPIHVAVQNRARYDLQHEEVLGEHFRLALTLSEGIDCPQLVLDFPSRRLEVRNRGDRFEVSAQDRRCPELPGALRQEEERTYHAVLDSLAGSYPWLDPYTLLIEAAERGAPPDRALRRVLRTAEIAHALLADDPPAAPRLPPAPAAPDLPEAPAAEAPPAVDPFIGYHVLVKCFHDGDPANNFQPSQYRAWLPRSVEGDLQGVLEKVDYIAGLGVDLVYLSPILRNRTTHGYDTVDYLRLAEHLSHADDQAARDLLRRLVDAFHARGVRVVMDLVLNHGGFDFDFGALPPGFSMKPRRAATAQEEAWQREPQGPSPWVQDGKPPFLYWDTEDEETQRFLVHAASFWLREAGLDGFRLDYVLGLPRAFLQRFSRALRAIRPDVILLGEIWDDRGSDERNYQLVGEYARVEGEQVLTSAFDFFLYGKLVHCVAERGAGLDVLWRHIQLAARQTSPRFDMVSFMENHDLPRFVDRAQGDLARWEVALGLLLGLTGSVMLEYGNEVALAGDREAFHHPHSDLFRRISSRVPMRFPEAWTERERARCDRTRRLLALRRTYRCLARGTYALQHVSAGTLAFWKHAVGHPSVLVHATLEPEHALQVPGRFRDLLSGDRLQAGDRVEGPSVRYLVLDPAA